MADSELTYLKKYCQLKAKYIDQWFSSRMCGLCGVVTWQGLLALFKAGAACTQ